MFFVEIILNKLIVEIDVSFKKKKDAKERRGKKIVKPSCNPCWSCFFLQKKMNQDIGFLPFQSLQTLRPNENLDN